MQPLTGERLGFVSTKVKLEPLAADRHAIGPINRNREPCWSHEGFVLKRRFSIPLFASLLMSCSAPDWQLPIRLADSREHVRSTLGDRRPCVSGSVSETCDSFPNSGISVEYDGDKVHGITIGGGKAGTDGIPYESQIVHGISIRDELAGLKAKLGEPIVIELGPPPRYKWRRPPWMIEVVIGTDREGEQKDKILWITITNAEG